MVQQKQPGSGPGPHLPDQRRGVEGVAEPGGERVEQGVRRGRHAPGTAGGDGARRGGEQLRGGDEQRAHLGRRRGAQAHGDGVVRLPPAEERAQQQRGVRAQRRHRVVRRRHSVSLHHAEQRAVHVVLLEVAYEGVLVHVVRGRGDDQQQPQRKHAHGQRGVSAAGGNAGGSGGVRGEPAAEARAAVPTRDCTPSPTQCSAHGGGRAQPHAPLEQSCSAGDEAAEEAACVGLRAGDCGDDAQASLGEALADEVLQDQRERLRAQAPDDET